MDAMLANPMIRSAVTSYMAANQQRNPNIRKGAGLIAISY
jgi:hypothetical protein